MHANEDNPTNLKKSDLVQMHSRVREDVPVYNKPKRVRCDNESK
jgi:hypothetical protein